MQLTISGTLRSLLPFFRAERDQEIAKIKTEDHGYIKGHISTRGPCPGLNSLANQGYLPRDGKNITIPRVEAALVTALHMSPTLAHTLASQLRPFLRPDGTFDLPAIRQHGVMERDVSFTRLDFRHGDNYTFQPAMFEAMLRDAGPGEVTTVESLARTYRRRQREEKEGGSKGLGLRLYFVSLVQTVSFLHSAEVEGKMSREVIGSLFEEERFAKVILENEKTRTLTGLVGMTLRLAWHVWFGGE
ncbi:Heme haloperoxidase family profile domain-containing protein [Madurella fahalii]|uniref:Heme haloperoxidase family profile domain-containing protein n=1 Tax=Madurella fahalii TaxID=1157608 RepID=A0ABQ0GQI2_9PEZI